MRNNTIMLEELERKHDYDIVNFKAKVIKIGDPVQVTPKLRKQEVTPANKSGASKLTVWKQNIGILRVLSLYSSYELTQFSVCTYRNEKSLSWPKDGASYSEFEDIGDMVEDDLPEAYINIPNAQTAFV